ncbi:hypothetical protein DICPUDRAFT_149410 [Dictyostelium purpureum]|uniref:Uncharacterized protein n=1 Tax=Dictyostelium purpureum TaxID=5786 RepID=F0ZDN2_DICPU|nr:uncharacterized protein DICPUDRAFT_149410 [Dictyostelium purpureum]EGC37945.1 hypothetical protein DICPUDRAFT_149410 [Dictyostelium purpureum]|eukprot:XP_003285516.1 hypothetical protein DICPUDRAFT_149410 [Dictyostelium purpureum]
MTILGSIVSLSNPTKSVKNQFIYNSSGLNGRLQGSNASAGKIGDVNRGIATVIGETTGIVAGAVIGGLDYAIEGALAGIAKGFAFGIL